MKVELDKVREIVRHRFEIFKVVDSFCGSNKAMMSDSFLTILKELDKLEAEIKAENPYAQVSRVMNETAAKLKKAEGIKDITLDEVEEKFNRPGAEAKVLHKFEAEAEQKKPDVTLGACGTRPHDHKWEDFTVKGFELCISCGLTRKKVPTQWLHTF
jgi:hypothetical protein